MSSKPKGNGARRQREYYERQKKRGFSRISVWVPKEQVERFYAAYNRLVKQWRKDGIDI